MNKDKVMELAQKVQDAMYDISEKLKSSSGNIELCEAISELPSFGSELAEVRLKLFPKFCCADATHILCNILLSHDECEIEQFRIVKATPIPSGLFHKWLWCDNYDIDITLGQDDSSYMHTVFIGDHPYRTDHKIEEKDGVLLLSEYIMKNYIHEEK